MVLSEKWILSLYKQENEDDKSELTFAGALEKCYQQISFYWNSTTKKKNISTYENIILPELIDHNEKNIWEYTKEDYEKTIENIKIKGYEKKGIHYPYQESSIQNFKKLIFYVVFHASCRGISENVLFGTDFEVDLEPTEENILEKTILKKSLTPKQEKLLTNILLEDIDAPGELVGVLLMLGLGLRNAEACGLNYGDIKSLQDYPEDKMAWVYKSTIPGTSRLQSGGKTWNSGRLVPVPSKIVRYLEKRRQLLRDYIDADEIVEIDEMPIVCKGYLSVQQNYKKRASAKDISSAARSIYKQIGMEAKQLAFVEKEISENNLDEVIKEKDATAYLLRRNFATHLFIQGLEISEIQYVLGHFIENEYESRNEYIEDRRLHLMAKKMRQRPYLNDEDTGCNTMEVEINPGEEFRITVKGQEPLDNLEITIEADKKMDGNYVTTAYEREYRRSIDITKMYHETYK